ncbi:hypothetical protein L596_012512 [Steinernema carpocapsae]|nr:hypothetical protein L596_012512 [Steinernema carpocapsae]
MSAECQAVYDILQNGSGNIPGMQQAPMLQQMMQQMQPSMPQPQLSSRPVAPPVNDSADRIVHRFLSALDDMEDLLRQQQENELLVNQRMNQRIQQQRRLIQSYLESRMDGDGRQ